MLKEILLLAALVGRFVGIPDVFDVLTKAPTKTPVRWR